LCFAEIEETKDKQAVLQEDIREAIYQANRSLNLKTEFEAINSHISLINEDIEA